MAWTETDPMKERLHFVTDWDRRLYTVTELCARYGVSRKTGYKWLARYADVGVAGLAERSRAPHRCPHRIAPAVAAAIVETRRQHPSWGRRKLLVWLADHRSGLELPAASTAGDLLHRRGLVRRRRRRRAWKHPGAPELVTAGPNDVWTADFKGHFRTGDGAYCYPLTVADQHSRYLLACDALASVRTEDSWLVFDRLFRDVGLPRAIRTDNGAPFCSTGIHGLCAMNVWWIRLGIAQQPPATVWHPSPRPYPRRLAHPEYPGHHLVRLVSNAGTFRFKAQQLFLSQALKQDYIGLEETADGVWSIYFYDVLLGKLHERDFRIYA